MYIPGTLASTSASERQPWSAISDPRTVNTLAGARSLSSATPPLAVTTLSRSSVSRLMSPYSSSLSKFGAGGAGAGGVDRGGAATGAGASGGNGRGAGGGGGGTAGADAG